MAKKKIRTAQQAVELMASTGWIESYLISYSKTLPEFEFHGYSTITVTDRATGESGKISFIELFGIMHDLAPLDAHLALIRQCRWIDGPIWNDLYVDYVR